MIRNLAIGAVCCILAALSFLALWLDTPPREPNVSPLPPEWLDEHRDDEVA